MDKKLKKLIEKTRDDDDARVLARALRRASVSTATLVELARADEEPLRSAAALAARGRDEPDVLEAMDSLASDESLDVRIALATGWADAPGWALSEAAQRAMLFDASYGVRYRAARGARGRPIYENVLLEMLDEDPSWECRQAAAGALREGCTEEVLVPLLTAIAEDDDTDVTRACAVSAEAHFAERGEWPESLGLPRVGLLEACRQQLKELGKRRYSKLDAWLGERIRTDVDPQSLSAFGAELTAEAEAGRLPRAHGVDRQCNAVLEAINGAAPRGVVFLGEAGTGKTAAVHETVHRLQEDPKGAWRVLRLSPSEIMAGTLYIGEWETKVRDILELVRAPRRVLLYVPNLEALNQAGRSSKSDSNIADMLAPHLESGDLAVLGESTPEAYRSGLGGVPSLRRLFRTVEFSEVSADVTREITEAVLTESGVEAEDAVLERLQELAGFYLAGSAEPGRTIGLLRRVLEGRPEDAGPLRQNEIVETLAHTTGVPLAILDDERALDLEAVRAAFERRVMGQPEAVEAVLDLVTLIKAGLTDPDKPYGVLFFVGPTGVGKTEMARALAEQLFGDDERLHRYDMSEYATYESYERLNGTPDRPGLLTEAVKEDPFAVFLLDEIEKAHGNVFDLCLQVFDAGRLTDGQGRTSDFRRTIFILTSNIGSAVATEAAVGFGGGFPPPPDPSAVERALRQVFRPEFLGRLDQIVHFRALSAVTAERIARRNVASVLERSGIARRGLAVDVDPGVLSFLLRRGYTPALGARLLKRTVERYVLLPVARAIARGAVPTGSIVRLRAQGDDVGVEVEPPGGVDAGGVAAARPVPGLQALKDRVTELVLQIAELQERSRKAEERRAALLSRSRGDGFWEERGVAVRVLDEIHRWDGVLTALGTLEKRVRDTSRHVERPVSGPRQIESLLDRVRALEAEQRRLAFLLGPRDGCGLEDALLVVTLVNAQGSALGGVEKLADMYAGFARRHGMEAEIIGERRGGDPREDAALLRVSGAGAHAYLRVEEGLHQFAETKVGARDRREVNRELVRVEVLAEPEDIRLSDDELRMTSQPLKGVSGYFLRKPKADITLLHVPSMLSISSWTDLPRRHATDRLLPVLCARVAAGGSVPDPTAGPVVRRYTLGASPLVRDRRTGLSTGRLDRVLAGDLDRFQLPPRAEAETNG